MEAPTIDQIRQFVPTASSTCFSVGRLEISDRHCVRPGDFVETENGDFVLVKNSLHFGCGRILCFVEKYTVRRGEWPDGCGVRWVGEAGGREVVDWKKLKKRSV